MVIAFLILFGLVFGSFVNALIYRVHDHSMGGKLSVMKGRSVCSNCRHQLAVKDLIPVFSWIWLRGKCRYCHKPIKDSPLVELALPLLFVASYVYWPNPIEGFAWLSFVLWLSFLVVGMALAVYDLRWFILPNKLVLTAILISIGYVLSVYFRNGYNWEALLSSLLASMLLLLIFYGLFIISKGDWMGGGDVKLVVALGLIASGPLLAMVLLFVASLIGTLVSLPLVAKNGGGIKLKIPFGPFLLMATFITFFWGQKLLDWLG